MEPELEGRQRTWGLKHLMMWTLPFSVLISRILCAILKNLFIIHTCG